MQGLLSMPPGTVARTLREGRVSLAWVVRDGDGVRVSHPELAALATELRRPGSAWDGHEALFLRPHAAHDALLGAFVHDTTRGQAAGGTRLWSYGSLADYLRDGLRLAQGMTRKNALAGLWWGGGKGVIGHDAGFDPRPASTRKALFHAYGELMTELRGCYVTAEDVGVTTADVAEIHARTRFVTCIPPEIGGSGDPSPHTARGVIAGIEAALEHLGLGAIAGKSFAVQGVGNVGGPLVRLLADKGARHIVGHDVSSDLVERRRAEWRELPVELSVVPRGDSSIAALVCDVFAPCALGAVLNADTIPRLGARIVCGAANNQLDDPARDGAALQARGIVYVPDFLVNRMGIVNCANEQYGYVDGDPMIERHLGRDWERSIHASTLQVLARVQATGVPPGEAATHLADELAREPHPIFPGRGRQIIEALTRA